MYTIESLIREGDRAALAALLPAEPEPETAPLPPSTAHTITITRPIQLAPGLVIHRTETWIVSGTPQRSIR